jgi:myo-inositol 2-dehydrogenase/D-chiro-inositol 1-dehydrogenase
MAKPSPSRRAFLQTSALATAGTVLIGTPAVHAAGNEKTLKIGLVGCGGRGGGAVVDAFTADKNIKLVALCDVFEDRLTAKLKELSDSYADRIDVPKERQYTGFDGYKQLIDSDVDVVLLCSTPGFRPIHLAYAVDKSKHIFMEKPHATDGTGVRSVLESVKKAKEKKLSLVSGFTYRYDKFKRETMKRIHDGVIGDMQTVHTTYLTSDLWYRGHENDSPMAYQLRNWYYYTWLSGDFLVEQHIHSIDKAAWVMNGAYPIAATGMGGRQTRTDKKYGHIFDHFTVVYEYENGSKVFSQCRQVSGCFGETKDYVYGTKGTAELMSHVVKPTGGSMWKHEGKHDLGKAYVQEHVELFDSIRNGKAINDGEWSAYSTLMGIMGREASYSGQRITWKQMLESKQNLQPATYSFDTVPPKFDVPTPGKYKFV